MSMMVVLVVHDDDGGVGDGDDAIIGFWENSPPRIGAFCYFCIYTSVARKSEPFNSSKHENFQQ
jgi:hypothetical protein